MTKRMTSKQQTIEAAKTLMAAYAALDERLLALMNAKKITSGAWLCHNRHDHYYYRSLHDAVHTFPVKDTERSIGVTLRLLQGTYDAALAFVEENEAATYETCQRTKVQVYDNGLEKLEDILAWARENGHLPTEEVAAPAPVEEVLSTNEQAQEADRVTHITSIVESTGVAVEIEVFSMIQLVGPFTSMYTVVEALKAAGYEVIDSEMFLGTYFIDKFGSLPEIAGACPECSHDKAHAHYKEIVSCAACGFQHIPVPVAATLEHIEEEAIKIPEPQPRKIKDAAFLTVDDIPKYIQEQLYCKVYAGTAPMSFHIKGTPGWKTAAWDSAIDAFDKLRKWAEGMGAEVAMLRDGFSKLPGGRHGKIGSSHASLVVEITDPAGRFIEQFLEKAHGKNWRHAWPKSRMHWDYFKQGSEVSKQ